MPKSNIEKTARESLNLKDGQLQKLKTLFPEIVADGKINWEKLKAILGESLDNSFEKFTFSWAGKSEAIKNVLISSKATLRPDKKEGVDFDKSENIFIEGDSLEVLKLLQNSYFETIKMIYIDPPYNDGEDRIYHDDFKSPLKRYLELSGQLDSQGNLLSTNTTANGRFHSDWLNMIYPRLKLSWNLLKDDGVIFISIDENELQHLLIVMNEIFGEENLEGIICWRRRHNQPNDKTKMIGKVAEFIVAYAKDSVSLKKSGVGKVSLTGNFTNPDNDPRGDWASKPWKVGSDQSGSRYEITSPTGKVFDEEWMGDENTYKALSKDNRIIFPRKGDGSPRKKYFKFEREEEGQCATNWWSHELFGHNQGAGDMLAAIFGERNIFSNPKPIELISGLLQIANTKSGDIVLDFFAGSGTTAHSVLALNKEDSERRQFIAVQLPEPLNPENEKQKIAYNFLKQLGKPTNIAEIAKERLRRVAKGYGGNPSLNDGFKVFKLGLSNYAENQFEFEPAKSEEENKKAFNSYLEKSSQQDFFKKATELDVIYENIIKEGLNLNSQIAEFNIGKNRIFKASNDKSFLLICLDQKIDPSTVSAFRTAEYKDKILIVFDAALEDSTKANLGLHLSLKTL